MALLRYPGSKEKHFDAIFSRFPDAMVDSIFLGETRWEYREPFFGAGAIGFEALWRISTQCRVWLNDADPAIHNLWDAVRDDRNGVLSHLAGFEPSVEAFNRFKAEDGDPSIPRDRAAFQKIAMHRMSYSGLGTMSGPIGGNDQASEFDVGCRWNPKAVKKEVIRLSSILRIPFQGYQFTNMDFAPLIEDAHRECFIYLDPPYYEKGPKLYKHSMNEEDHVRLSDLLRKTEATWVLSYDNHDAIRDLYSWANIDDVDFTYTIATRSRLNGVPRERPKNKEVIITPKND